MISPQITDELEEMAAKEQSSKEQPERYRQCCHPGNGGTVFDIETGPNDIKIIKSLSEPFTAPSHPGEFDPRSVRVGNLKDPEKIMLKIEEAKAAHSQAVMVHEYNITKAETDYWLTQIEKAPLSPILGRVLAIGFCDANENTHTLVVGNIYDDDAEADIIDEFWCKWFVPIARAGGNLIGHNIAGFDIPFLVRRSWILGVDVPRNVMDQGWRYLSSVFVDTRSCWECGVRSFGGNGVPANLDIVGRVLGEGAKTEGMTGSDFWKLLYSKDSENVEKALGYLRNDVVLNSRVARRMGVM